MKKLIMSIFIFGFVFLGVAYPASLTISEHGDIFAETDRYQVRFQKGSVIHLHNKLTQETYTRQGIETLPDGDHHFAFNSYRITGADSLEAEKVAPLTAKLTVRWYERRHEKTLIMWVSIDELTGDLIIKQEGSDQRHGAATIGWRFGNLDHDQVSLIVPANGGTLINAESPPHWEFDGPGINWQARLAILEGHAGGCSIMSLDEEYRFSRLNYTRSPDAFQLEFITDNFFSFEENQHITSTIWRLNTYRGDWQVPAETYRQGMIQRNAARVARPPAWVKDIQLVIMYCSFHRPQHILRMFDFVAKQIDPKNVLFYCRGGWHTGEMAVEAGWPDHPVREDLSWFISAAKSRGFRVMLYTVLQFVSPNHQHYAEWDHCLYRGERGGISGYELETGGPAFINPACSSFRDYKVQVLKNLQSTYNIDAFHLDVNSYIANGALIEGLTPIQGTMLLHEELIEAMPGTLFSGEYIHEVTAPYVALYSRGDNYPNFAHPITDFLFSQWSLAYGSPLAYLGDRPGGLEHRILIEHINYYKQVEVIPTIRYHYEGHLL